MMSSILVIVLAAAASGQLADPDSATGAGLVGVATGVAVVIARVLQQLWPSKSDSNIGELVAWVKQMVTEAKETNSLLTDLKESQSLISQAIGEQRRDFSRIETTLRDHMIREEASLRSVDTTIARVALHLPNPSETHKQ